VFLILLMHGANMKKKDSVCLLFVYSSDMKVPTAVILNAKGLFVNNKVIQYIAVQHTIE
jgi:hypothetical protein